MRKTKNGSSPKKSIKKSNVLSSVDLHSICIRLNHIIERSNAIDNQLSLYEKQITRNQLTPISMQEDPISEYGNISPNSKSHLNISSPPTVSTKISFSDNTKLSPKSLSNTYQESPITIKTDNQISLKDLYDLMIEMKQQITEIARNQEVMQKEILQLKSSY